MVFRVKDRMSIPTEKTYFLNHKRISIPRTIDATIGSHRILSKNYRISKGFDRICWISWNRIPMGICRMSETVRIIRNLIRNQTFRQTSSGFPLKFCPKQSNNLRGDSVGTYWILLGIFALGCIRCEIKTRSFWIFLLNSCVFRFSVVISIKVVSIFRLLEHFYVIRRSQKLSKGCK